MKDNGRLLIRIFAWIFITGAVLSLLSLAVSLVNPSQWKQVEAKPLWLLQLLLSLLLGFTGLIAGINALRFSPFSRRLLLWVAAINLIEIIIFIPLVYAKAPLLSADKALPAGTTAGQYLMNYIIAVTPVVVFYCLFIYFFSRPQIKNHFK